jgi:hypothetical protein
MQHDVRHSDSRTAVSMLKTLKPINEGGKDDYEDPSVAPVLLETRWPKSHIMVKVRWVGSGVRGGCGGGCGLW